MFQYKSRTADKVELVGDFNHWKPEPMYLDSAHVWVTVKDLKAGPYHYVFLVNGKREVRDPWNTSFDPSQRAHGVSSFVVPEVNPTF
jgi:1,4-alpha-glucan branching enzyme